MDDTESQVKDLALRLFVEIFTTETGAKFTMRTCLKKAEDVIEVLNEYKVGVENGSN